jgi:hypothetical protein
MTSSRSLMGGIAKQGRRAGLRLVGGDDEFKIMMGRGRGSGSFINEVLRARQEFRLRRFGGWKKRRFAFRPLDVRARPNRVRP